MTMKKTKMTKMTWMATASLALMLTLGACGNDTPEQPSNQNGQTNTEATSGTNEQPGNEGTDEGEVEESTEPEETTQPGNTEPADTKPAPGDTPDTSSSAADELPVELPDDFPLPEDATIDLANTGDYEGKKSAMVIFTTEEDMQTVTQMYKEYFEGKDLTDATLLFDDKNIVVQGVDPQKQQIWSMIGGAMASQEGVIELTLNWTES